MVNFNSIWKKCLEYNIEKKPEELRKLLNLLETQTKKNYALLIGTNLSAVSLALCYLYKKVIVIDIKYHNDYDKIKSEFNNFEYIIGDLDSNAILNTVKNLGIEFDFTFIDGDPLYTSIKSNYERFKQFSSNEGLIGFYDIIDSEFNNQLGKGTNLLWKELNLGKKYEFICSEKTYEFEDSLLTYTLDTNKKYSDFGGVGVIQNIPITTFVHNYLDNHWLETVVLQVNRLINSGLYKSSHKIFFGVYSNSKDNIYLFESIVKKYDIDLKINTIIFDQNMYEFSTLILLQNYCKINKNGISLYYHTKGTSHKIKHPNIESWRECLEYFNIDKWRTNFDIINYENFDVCGALYVTWFSSPNFKLEKYYAGNFWWAKNSYISNLPNLGRLYYEQPQNRHLCEAWLGMSPHIWFNHYSVEIDYLHYYDPKDYKV
jgi:mRNA-degrading endonuclease HigB of HigAB toxin-antitoxin module